MLKRHQYQNAEASNHVNISKCSISSVDIWSIRVPHHYRINHFCGYIYFMEVSRNISLWLTVNK